VPLATSAFLLLVALSATGPARPEDARCAATWDDPDICKCALVCDTKNHAILLACRDPLNRVRRFDWKSEAELMGQTGRVSASFSLAKRMVGFTDPAGGQIEINSGGKSVPVDLFEWVR
jgi:hypothetical protein